MLEGSCHCGALRVRFETELAPSLLPVRVCGCTFCQRHRPRYTCDPAGHVTFEFAEAAINRYRFGLAQAEFLLCKTCGVFAGAYRPDHDRAVINLEVLARANELTGTATAFTAYDSEDAAARTARQLRNWTPATSAARS